jgi:hypothetical protein
MLGVLVVVLCRDDVTGLSLSLGQRDISLVVSSRVVRAVRGGAV